MKRLALVLAVSLIAAACGSEEEDARRTLEERGTTVDADGFLGRVRAGDLEAVELFLRAGMDPDARDAKGTAALVAIAGNGTNERQLEITQRLLDADADANIDDGLALVRAGFSGNRGVVEALLDAGADVDAADPSNGKTSLMQAAWQGNADVAELLIDEGANVDARETKYGWTALMIASDRGELEVVKLLLDADADVTVTTENGRSARRLANWNKGRGPTPLGIEDGQLVLGNVYAEIVHLLDDAGAEP
jgi:ankyrin repeat protein